MLDAFLACTGCFGRGHRFWHMPFEWDAPFCCLVGDREVNVARQPAVDLDEVGTTLLLLIHYFAPLRFIRNNNRIGPGWVWTIDDGTAQVNDGRWIRIGRLRGAPSMGVGRT